MNTISDHDRHPCELLIDDDAWYDVLGPALSKDPARAESLAYLLNKIRTAIDNGSDDIRRAGATLQRVIRLIYLHTDEHRAALELFELWLSGRVTAQNAPRQLINEAIERARAEIKDSIDAEGRKSEPKRKHR